MMMFVENEKNGDGDDDDEQGKIWISMLELDNFKIIETREAEIEYWDCEMNLRIEVIDDHISNWSGPSALESISRGCDISINISCAPHHIIGHVSVCVRCIWYDWCPLSSGEDVFYLIDEVIALGADYWSKWYSIRAKWNTALTIHFIQDWTASTKWHFPRKMEKRDKNEGNEVGWVHRVLARNGFICSRKCRSLTVGQIISTTKEIQIFCCPRNIIC